MNRVVLCLGSNIPPREKFLEKAVMLLESRIGSMSDVSNIYETEPWGFQADPFLNQSVSVLTQLDYEQVLEETQAIELLLGRKKKTSPAGGYSSRTIDIDLIFFNDDIISTENLQIPHPRMAERRFVLATLRDIIPEYIHPLLKKNILTLYKECEDTSKVTALTVSR